jgi:hypothetical protein
MTQPLSLRQVLPSSLQLFLRSFQIFIFLIGHMTLLGALTIQIGKLLTGLLSIFAQSIMHANSRA